MNNLGLPILYSFRRCPYAMRARIALYYSGVQCQLREVVLKSKPDALLAVSPKATVPVLVLNQQTSSPVKVIDESIEIIEWALNQSDPDGWLSDHTVSDDLIIECDTEFKSWLDKYKYFDRYPENSQSFYFEKGLEFLTKLESLFTQHTSSSDSKAVFLKTNKRSVLDIAIFPFVRQFAFVDKNRFDQLELPKLHSWLTAHLESKLFSSVMTKYDQWIEGESNEIIFGANTN